MILTKFLAVLPQSFQTNAVMFSKYERIVVTLSQLHRFYSVVLNDELGRMLEMVMTPEFASAY
jgi:hypothetical protein